MPHDLAWFLLTSWGKAWADIDALQYDSAYILVSNDPRVVDVENNCPDLYDQVLSMAIAEFLAQSVIADDGEIRSGSELGDDIAYVTSDKVADISRNYALTKAAESTLKHKPLNVLDRIFDQCKSIAGAMRIAVAGDDCGCSDGRFRTRRIRIGDMTDGW